MRRTLLVISILFMLITQFSCVKKAALPQSPANTAPPVTQPPVITEKTYLALGDSYTIGSGVPPHDCYPIQTKNWLKDNGIAGMKDPQIIAASGWTTANLQAAIATENPTGPFGVVSILIGVNDQFRGADTAVYRIRFTQLLEKCISLTGNLPSHVFVLSIPDYSVTPFGRNFDVDRVSKEIDEFNAINKEISISFNVQYLDITPLTREMKNDPGLVSFDGLHPSGLEYEKWAEKLAPLIKAILE